MIFLGALAGFGCWVALSWLWSLSPPRTMLEIQRCLLYAAGFLALLLLARRRSLATGLASLLAVLVGICGHALASRLLPDYVQLPPHAWEARLPGVFNYPNALGICAVIGLLPALGFAAHARHLPARVAAAAVTVPLVMTLFFAYGRGSWISLGVGIVSAVALAQTRKPLLALRGPVA